MSFQRERPRAKGPKRETFEEMLRRDPSLAAAIKRVPSSVAMARADRFGARLQAKTVGLEEARLEADAGPRRPSDEPGDDPYVPSGVEIDLADEPEDDQ